jgi:hypothetical protein
LNLLNNLRKVEFLDNLPVTSLNLFFFHFTNQVLFHIATNEAQLGKQVVNIRIKLNLIGENQL